MKTKSLPRKAIVKKLDSIYSQYIRLKDAVNGEATCVTCGRVSPWREMQNGHFYTRGRYATRWDDDNCHVQCAGCNVFLKGNYINYTRYMIDRYGREFVDELDIRSQSIRKFSTPELMEMLSFYQTRVQGLIESGNTEVGAIDNLPVFGV